MGSFKSRNIAQKVIILMFIINRDINEVVRIDPFYTQCRVEVPLISIITIDVFKPDVF